MKLKRKWWLAAIGIIVLVLIIIWQPWGYRPGSKDFRPTGFNNTTDLKPDYIQEKKGKITVQIPETYELLHVVIALGEYGSQNEMIFKNTDYYREVKDYFSAYSEHPIVTKVSQSLTKSRGNYNHWKNYTVSYRFEGNKIVHAGNHRVPSQNVFGQNLDLFSDFAEKSDYLEFYRNHQDFYQKQIVQFEAEAPVKKMWSWLESNFPVSYQSHSVFFSPLAGSTPHNTYSFVAKDQDFKEAFMFVQGPDSYYNRFSDKIALGLFNSNFFTEIDHNYVNPLTDKYLKEIVKAFRNLPDWNKQQGYSRIPLTFNEYMTWATFTLFACDNFDQELFDKARDIQEQIMVNSRGFVRYKEFNEKMLELNKNRQPGETVSDLYPAIIEWAGDL